MDQRSQQPALGAVHGEAALIRAVGTFALTAAVINVIIGGGIFRMPAALSTQVGIAAPIALIAGALAIIPIALCFAAVGSRVAATGGPYTYLTAAFGQFAGFIAGALMWISNITSSAGVAAALSEQVANLVPALAGPVPRALLITGVYAVLFALNAFGVKIGARAIVALATLKLTPLFLLAAIGIWFVDWNLVSFSVGDVPSWTALGASMALVMFAYSGMETALVPSGELRDPSRNVPRATVAAILLVVLLYLGLQIVGQGVLGAGLGTSKVPVADTAGALWGPGRILLLITACISMTGFMMGNLLGTSRLVYALGRDGYLPRVFGRVTETHRVPMNALIAHATPAWILAIAGSFDTLALISGGAICLVYGLVSFAAWWAQRKDLRERGDAPFVLPGGPVIPLIAVASMVLVVFTLTSKELTAIGVALAALVAIYAGLHLNRKRAP
ncbi:APC family permease [Noviluteimonas gilva]|nr:APC family permease [Lysobacter gilvus]